MVSILDKTSFFLAMAKIVATLGPRSRFVNTISACLMPGTSNRSDMVSTRFANIDRMIQRNPEEEEAHLPPAPYQNSSSSSFPHNSLWVMEHKLETEDAKPSRG